MSHSRLVSYISGALLLVALLLAVPAARAQGGPNYTLNWWTVDDGGATSGGAGGYTLGGTIGQPDAAAWAGGGYTLSGGFWPQAAEGANQAPLANAGPDQGVDAGAAVTLDGSGSSDPDGHTPLTYGWAQAGGPVVTFTPNLSLTTFTAPLSPAVLTFTLTVTDSLGLAGPTPDEVVVTVGPRNLYLPLIVKN